MSSVRRGASPKARPGPGERPPRKPIFTPVNVGIFFAGIVIVGVGIYIPMVHRATTAEIANIKNEIEKQKQQAEIFRKKAQMLPKAEELDKVMASKIKDEQKYFLHTQREIIPFLNDWLADLFNRYGWPEKLEIDPKLSFKISWLMEPYETVADPSIQRLLDLFEWEYIGEGSGSGEVTETLPNFLEPITFKAIGIRMRYEDLRDMIRDLQTNKTYHVTVHAFKNSESDNEYLLVRTRSKYDLLFTVYFMNPEGMVSGEKPPGMPDDKKL